MDARNLWKAVYKLIRRRPPQVQWTNGYSYCWFSKGFNPNEHGSADWRRVR